MGSTFGAGVTTGSGLGSTFGAGGHERLGCHVGLRAGAVVGGFGVTLGGSGAGVGIGLTVGRGGAGIVGLSLSTLTEFALTMSSPRPLSNVVVPMIPTYLPT